MPIVLAALLPCISHHTSRFTAARVSAAAAAMTRAIHTTQTSLTDNNWPRLVEALHSGDRELCLSALSHIAAVLSTIEGIQDSSQRWRVAHLIVEVFDALVGGGVPQLMVDALGVKYGYSG